MGDLEQSTTFRPFPRKLFAFAPVTGTAGQHDITDIVGRNIHADYPINRVSMFNVIIICTIFLLAKLGMTALRIVAAVFLPFQKFLDLRSSVGTSNLFLLSLSSMPCSILLRSMSLAIRSAFCSQGFTVRFPINRFLRMLYFWMCLSISFCPLALTLFALRVKSIFLSLVPTKVLRSSGPACMAHSAFFLNVLIEFWRGFLVPLVGSLSITLIHAWPTGIKESIPGFEALLLLESEPSLPVEKSGTPGKSSVLSILSLGG